MKILNLYAGIGGNRKLWEGNHEITSIENNEDILEAYCELYPNDKVVLGNAIEYLEKHYHKYDFIWSSPPCQSHSQYRHNVGVLGKGYKPIVPDASLYSQILFLDTYFKGIYVVENVIPYYKPLIRPTAKLQRHLFWSNVELPKKDDTSYTHDNIRGKNKLSDFEDYYKIKNSKIKNKRQVLRNQTNSNLSKYIFDFIFNNVQT